MTVATEQRTSTAGYMLPRHAGVIDLWWPFEPMPPGARYSIKTAGDQTEGRLLQILMNDGRGAAPPLHIHHDADETFFVLDGEMTIFVGDERIECGPGDFVFGARGVPHAFLVQSERAEFMVTFAPAGLERFFADVAVPVVPGEPAPEPVAADEWELTRKAAAYGVEIIGPPPTLD